MKKLKRSLFMKENFLIMTTYLITIMPTSAFAGFEFGGRTPDFDTVVVCYSKPHCSEQGDYKTFHECMFGPGTDANSYLYDGACKPERNHTSKSPLHHVSIALNGARTSVHSVRDVWAGTYRCNGQTLSLRHNIVYINGHAAPRYNIFCSADDSACSLWDGLSYKMGDCDRLQSNWL
jgi:hypothetical protein